MNRDASSLSPDDNVLFEDDPEKDGTLFNSGGERTTEP